MLSLLLPLVTDVQMRRLLTHILSTFIITLILFMFYIYLYYEVNLVIVVVTRRISSYPRPVTRSSLTPTLRDGTLERG